VCPARINPALGVIARQPGTARFGFFSYRSPYVPSIGIAVSRYLTRAASEQPGTVPLLSTFTLVHGVHEGAAGLVEKMRGGAGDLESELVSIRQELLTVRPEPEAEPEPELAAASEDFQTAGAGWPSAAERAAAGVGNGAAQEPEREPTAPPAPAAEEPVQPAEAPAPEVPAPAAEEAATAPAAAGIGGAGPEGARLVALNMALNGTPREEAARYLADNFELEDQEAILDDVYSRVGGRA